MVVIYSNRKINSPEITESEGCIIKLWHKQSDGEKANRLLITDRENEFEFLPSKGLSVGQMIFGGKSLFWDQPSDLVNPDKFDIHSNDLHINGKPAPGFMYIANYCAGVELLGLTNWGMPVQEKVGGRWKVLHGEAASIPVNKVIFNINPELISIEASFIYRTFRGLFLKPWYRRGKKLFELKRKVIIDRATGSMELTDSIINISRDTLVPDWGYHVTFRAEPGAQYLVPAEKAEYRGGGKLPPDCTFWQPSPDDKQRIEHGIIYKELTSFSPEKLFQSKLVYPDGSNILVKTTPSPYFQTWFCTGGSGSKEFTWKNGEPVLKKNWDGMGIEFGSSALDHDGNIDPSVVPEKALKPGESRQIVIKIEPI